MPSIQNILKKIVLIPPIQKQIEINCPDALD